MNSVDLTPIGALIRPLGAAHAYLSSTSISAGQMEGSRKKITVGKSEEKNGPNVIKKLEGLWGHQPGKGLVKSGKNKPRARKPLITATYRQARESGESRPGLVRGREKTGAPLSRRRKAVLGGWAGRDAFRGIETSEGQPALIIRVPLTRSRWTSAPVLVDKGAQISCPASPAASWLFCRR